MQKGEKMQKKGYEKGALMEKAGEDEAGRVQGEEGRDMEKRRTDGEEGGEDGRRRRRGKVIPATKGKNGRRRLCASCPFLPVRTTFVIVLPPMRVVEIDAA
jgi:hypothetical protein